MVDHLALAVAFDNGDIAVIGHDRRVPRLVDIRRDRDVETSVGVLHGVSKALAKQTGKIHGHGPIVVEVVEVVVVDEVVVVVEVVVVDDVVEVEVDVEFSVVDVVAPEEDDDASGLTPDEPASVTAVVDGVGASTVAGAFPFCASRFWA